MINDLLWIIKSFYQLKSIVLTNLVAAWYIFAFLKPPPCSNTHALRRSLFPLTVDRRWVLDFFYPLKMMVFTCLIVADLFSHFRSFYLRCVTALFLDCRLIAGSEYLLKLTVSTCLIPVVFIFIISLSAYPTVQCSAIAGYKGLSR